MSEEENLEELLRQKIEEQEFIFDESNWEKAESMIDASRKRKKRLRFFIIFLSGIIGGVIGTLMFTVSDAGSNSSDLVVNTVPVTHQSSNEEKNGPLIKENTLFIKKEKKSDIVEHSDNKSTPGVRNITVEKGTERNNPIEKTKNNIVANKNITVSNEKNTEYISQATSRDKEGTTRKSVQKKKNSRSIAEM
ncbi:MAG TPA: hypothetical protein VNX68_13525, partial [Nitrosopumilaceae archaeon]|nr:hypothetical protein [Nitrosopumilaceae archaeon]